MPKELIGPGTVQLIDGPLRTFKVAVFIETRVDSRDDKYVYSPNETITIN